MLGYFEAMHSVTQEQYEDMRKSGRVSACHALLKIAAQCEHPYFRNALLGTAEANSKSGDVTIEELAEKIKQSTITALTLLALQDEIAVFKECAATKQDE